MKTYYETSRGNCREVEGLEIAKLELQQDNPSAVFGDKDTYGGGWRVLVWASEADAENDDGHKAIGQIVRR